MKVRKTRNYQRAVELTVRRVISATGRPKFRRTDRPVRCSSPPVCEIATAFMLIRGGGVRTESFLMEFHTTVGTVSHQLFQKWAGRLGLLYGIWECSACGTQKVGRGPAVCSKCHQEMVYKEMRVEVAPGLEGSTDGLIPVDKDTYVVMDLKFVGKTVLSQVSENGPVPLHYQQVNLYAYGLKRKHKDLNIAGVAIIYLSKADPRQFKVHYFPGIDTKVVNSAKKILNRVRTIITKKPEKVAELRPLCTSPEDAPYCPFQNICFNKESGTTPHAYLRTLLKYNPVKKK